MQKLIEGLRFGCHEPFLEVKALLLWFQHRPATANQVSVAASHSVNSLALPDGAIVAQSSERLLSLSTKPQVLRHRSPPGGTCHRQIPTSKVVSLWLTCRSLSGKLVFLPVSQCPSNREETYDYGTGQYNPFYSAIDSIRHHRIADCPSAAVPSSQATLRAGI